MLEYQNHTKSWAWCLHSAFVSTHPTHLVLKGWGVLNSWKWLFWHPYWSCGAAERNTEVGGWTSLSRVKICRTPCSGSADSVHGGRNSHSPHVRWKMQALGGLTSWCKQYLILAWADCRMSQKVLGSWYWWCLVLNSVLVWKQNLSFSHSPLQCSLKIKKHPRLRNLEPQCVCMMCVCGGHVCVRVYAHTTSSVT